MNANERTIENDDGTAGLYRAGQHLRLGRDAAGCEYHYDSSRNEIFRIDPDAGAILLTFDLGSQPLKRFREHVAETVGWETWTGGSDPAVLYGAIVSGSAPS